MSDATRIVDGAVADSETLDRLSQLDPVAYDRARTEEARKLKVRAATLDRQVAARRDEAPAEGAGRSLKWPILEPWLDLVAGAVLLDEIVSVVRRYVVLPPGSDAALALWVLHAHAFEASPVTPRLAVVSPEKRCGKTTTLEIIQALTPKPILASNVSAAAVFRTIELARPTLLIDEADTFIPGAEELRGVLNSGHRRTGEVIRAVGEDHEPRRFSTWAPVAIAMIGKLPGTLDDRSVKVELRRRMTGEQVERWRADRAVQYCDLVRRCARWAIDHHNELEQADPAVPSSLHDRAADNWRPLLAIADAAGGDWPERARRAAVALSAGGEADGRREMLLLDLQEIFSDRGNPDWIKTEELIKSLVDMTERPWSESSRGKPINPSALRSLLDPFKIYSSHNLDKTARGYRRASFNEAWSRYLPSGGGSGEATRPPVPKPAIARVADPIRPVQHGKPLDGSNGAERPGKSSVRDGWTGRASEAAADTEEIRLWAPPRSC